MPLLETLIAFVIAAISLGVLVEVSADGLRSARVASHYQEALSRAQSRLAAISVAPAAGQQAGDDGGGFAWRVLVIKAADDPRAGGLYLIRVMVSWTSDGGRREVSLVTERLGGDGPAVP